MSELDHDIREGLDRLASPTARSHPLTLARLGTRRRQRRVRNTMLTTLPIVAVLAILGLVSRGGDGTVVTADATPETTSPPTAISTVSVVRTEVVGSDGGTTRVVMEFDRPLPGRSIDYVDDITAVPAGDQMVYSTQQAGHVQVCESVHSFPAPATGTVDLLIPADWFTEGNGTYTSELDEINNPAKFVVCGPTNGFCQYSVWGAVSADPFDVTATVDPDRTRLTIEIDPPSAASINGPAAADEACKPATADPEPLIGGLDVEARTSRGDHAWALFFNAEPAATDEPVTVKIDTELKIVWQATGEGDPAFVAVGPDNTEIVPTSGPNLHDGSNWDRVTEGDEWDTGWIFPNEGCWRFELSRNDTPLATLDILVVP